MNIKNDNMRGRIFGKQYLLYNKDETRAVAPAERKVPSRSFLCAFEEEVANASVFNVLQTSIAELSELNL